MTPEKTKILFDKFPQLYRQNTLPMTKGCMQSFSCSDGWFDIIYQLSESIDNLCKLKGIEGEEYPAAEQVKEKFGGLRFYLGSMPGKIFEDINNLVTAAENMSYETCESCGSPGKESTCKGWVRTLCENCEKERETI